MPMTIFGETLRSPHNAIIRMLSFFWFVFEGELLGMEYLYSQTGRTLAPVLHNPEEEEEDRLVELIDDDDVQDEGFEDDGTEDITVPVLYEDDPSRQLENRPSSTASPQASPPQDPASPARLPPSHQGDVVHVIILKCNGLYHSTVLFYHHETDFPPLVTNYVSYLPCFVRILDILYYIVYCIIEFLLYYIEVVIYGSCYIILS